MCNLGGRILPSTKHDRQESTSIPFQLFCDLIAGRRVVLSSSYAVSFFSPQLVHIWTRDSDSYFGIGSNSQIFDVWTVDKLASWQFAFLRHVISGCVCVVSKYAICSCAGPIKLSRVTKGTHGDYLWCDCVLSYRKMRSNKCFWQLP